MINVITVEREFGSLGADYARHLAEHLGWRLVDHSLLRDIAALAGVSEKVVASCDERLDPWYHSVGKAFWHGSMEIASGISERNLFDSQKMTGYLQKVVRDEAAAGKCVLVGRGASSLLNGVDGCFHVFVYATMARKMRWFEQQFPNEARNAEQEILATDQRRQAYIRRLYNHEWDSRQLYHLLLNSCMGHDAMVGATLEAAGLAHSVNLV
jgi:cytidylate kinase